MFDVRRWPARHPLALWRAGMLVAVLSLPAGAALWRPQATERAAAAAALDQARARFERAAGERRPPPPAADTFVSTLPATLEAEQIVQRLAATALLHAVALTDSRIERPRAGPESELPRATLHFSLRGPYPGIKATLAETLARTVPATLHSLNIRREGKVDIETQVVLSLWLRPASAAAPAN